MWSDSVFHLGKIVLVCPIYFPLQLTKKLKLVTDTDNLGLEKKQENIFFLLSLLKNSIFITLCAASSERENSFSVLKVLKLHILNLMYRVLNISNVGMTDNKTHS